MIENVSRGTHPGTERAILFKKAMRAAIEAGTKDHTRRVVAKNNSRVHPGTFEGLDLSSGRARRLENPEIRARCTFESGRVRVVTVSPLVRRGDLFWIKANRFTSRAKACGEIEVLGVDVARVQDMTDEDAIREGVQFHQPQRKRDVETYAALSPRSQFAVLWDDINGHGAWERNDWVWIYRFRSLAHASPGGRHVREEEANAHR